MMGLKSAVLFGLSLEPVNAMTNKAKTGYDSAIEQSIAQELAFGGIGAIRWLSMIWKLFSYRIH